jgi:hypothetical protein
MMLDLAAFPGLWTGGDLKVSPSAATALSNECHSNLEMAQLTDRHKTLHTCGAQGSHGKDAWWTWSTYQELCLLEAQPSQCASVQGR